jgi:secretion/DNA translocation related CpaE-like protein
MVDGRRPVALVGDEVVLDDLLRLAAAAGCELERSADVVALRRRWALASMIVLDPAGVTAASEAGLARRESVFVVCPAAPDPGVWQRAVQVGAEKVLVLPTAETWLTSAFADAVEQPAARSGRLITVLGGRGGAGASVLATAVALAALARGDRTLLVDCDPLGGGLDLVLAAEAESGLRWPQLTLSGGRVAASALREALPGRTSGPGRLTLLSCDRSGPGPAADAVAAVVESGRRAGDTVVCDLPRDLTPGACAALDRADLTVLVVPAEVRACAAARRVAEHARERGASPQVVVRGPAPGGLRPDDVADAVDLPLLTSMRSEQGLATMLERGQMRTRERGPLATAARAVLDAVPLPASGS